MTLAIGFIIGLVLGLTGAGGSLMAVPLLTVFLHQSPSEAAGLALGAVAASSAWGAVGFIRRKQVLWAPAILFGLGGVLLAPVGRWLASLTNPFVLTLSFVLLAMTIAGRMLWHSWRHPAEAALVRADVGIEAHATLQCGISTSHQFEWKPRCMAGLLSGGVLTGLLSGFLGVGGGFLIVPFLTQLNKVDIRAAAATSLLIIAAISSAGFAMDLASGTVEASLLPLLAAGSIGGMMAGTRLARHVAGTTLQRIFAFAIIGMALLSLTTGD